MAQQKRRVEEAAEQPCGVYHCGENGAAKIRGTWYCIEHANNGGSRQ